MTGPYLFDISAYQRLHVLRPLSNDVVAGHPVYFYFYLCVSLGDERGVYRVLVGKPEGKRPLGRPRRR